MIYETLKSEAVQNYIYNIYIVCNRIFGKGKNNKYFITCNLCHLSLFKPFYYFVYVYDELTHSESNKIFSEHEKGSSCI